MSKIYDSNELWSNFTKLRPEHKVVDQFADKFQADIFSGELGEIFKNSKWRSLYGSFGQTEFASTRFAGRIMVTLQKTGTDTQITFVGTESDNKISGVQSYYGTLSDFENMIFEVQNRFENAHNKAETLQPEKLYINGSVPIGGKPDGHPSREISKRAQIKPKTKTPNIKRR
jgi:hypothetical protein